MERVIQWGGNLAVLTSEDTDKLRKVGEGAPPEELGDLSYLGQLFLRLLANLQDKDVLDLIVKSLKPLIANHSFCQGFGAAATEEQLRPVLNQLNICAKKQGSGQTAENMMLVLSAILCGNPVEKHRAAVTSVLDICVQGLTNPNVGFDCIPSLGYLLRNPEIRQMFIDKKAIHLLTDRVIASSNETQQQYQLGFCLWMLTFSNQAIPILLFHKVIPKCHDTLKNYKKEKCCRIALATMLNIIKWQDEQEKEPTMLPEGIPRINVYHEMITLQVLRVLGLLSKKTFADPDISDMVNKLYSALDKRIEATSSFGDYKQEVLSGRLEWTPVHKSEKFWKENLKEFEADNYGILRELTSILCGSQDPHMLSIALHDFGEFTRFHPNGRKIIQTLGAKGRIIELLESSNEEVKKEALMCTQKLLVKNWEFLQN